ncbi:MAG: hypothetical protein GY769_07240 [bacterium]|nr:hypothetical protein [bacterium]
MTRIDREHAILAQLEAGNVPRFLRQLRRIELRSETALGPGATIWVMPDYLAVGSDEDFVRVPLDFHSAKTIARRFGFVLPTCKIVNHLFGNSELRLSPQPMQAGPQMRSTAYYLAHSRLIDEQRAGYPLGLLLAGHKKDLVLTRRLARTPSRVAIYGWHRPNGRPIQPLSTIHSADYADYSHGVRLVSATALIGDELRSVYEASEDPSLAGLLSNEGEIPGIRSLMGL